MHESIFSPGKVLKNETTIPLFRAINYSYVLLLRPKQTHSTKIQDIYKLIATLLERLPGFTFFPIKCLGPCNKGPKQAFFFFFLSKTDTVPDHLKCKCYSYHLALGWNYLFLKREKKSQHSFMEQNSTPYIFVATRCHFLLIVDL